MHECKELEIDHIDTALKTYEVFFADYARRYRAMINTFNEGLEEIRGQSLMQIQENDLEKERKEIPDDGFSILDDMDNVDGRLFKVCIIATMYSETELGLKDLLGHLYDYNMTSLNIDELKNKYRETNIDLEKLKGFADFECLRSLNNCINHNAGTADRYIHCSCLSKIFYMGETVNLSEDQIVKMAESISRFMLDAVHAVTESLL